MFGNVAAEIYRPRPEKFIEPTDGTSRYRPWGAVPADPFFDEELKKRQRYVDSQLEKLFTNPPDYIPPAFADMLWDDYIVGEQRRKMNNHEGFGAWRNNLTIDIPIELQDVEKYIITGDALPDEIINYILTAKSLDQDDHELSLELGKLTHVYGRRLEHIAGFRSEVDDAITQADGYVYDKLLPYRSIDIEPRTVDGDQGNRMLGGLIVKYKRDVGRVEIPGGSGVLRVVERQIAGYRIDEESGFDQTIAKKLLTSDTNWDNPDRASINTQLRSNGCTEFVETAVQADSLESFVVPVSTTIFAFYEPYSSKTERFVAEATRRGISEVNGMPYFPSRSDQ